QAAFNYNSQLWNVTGGISLLQNYGKQQDLGRDSALKQHSISPALRTNITHTGKKSSWSFNSTANYILPSLQQLQPVQNLTNPLYVIQGNPDLRPQVNYTGGFNWSTRKVQVNGKPVAIVNTVSTNWNAVSNQIVTSTLYDSLGKQTVTYANVNGI